MRRGTSGGEPIFGQFQRDYRPLSEYLLRRFAAPLLERIARYSSDDLGVSSEELVKTLCEEVRVAAPSLHGTEAGRSDDETGDWRPGAQRGWRLRTSRHYVAIEVQGDVDLLEHWPDGGTTVLRPVDEFDEDPWADDDVGPYDAATAVRRHEQQLDRKRWFLARRHDDEPRSLYTFIDLTEGDEMAVAERGLDPRTIIDERRADVEPIVTAIAEQTRRFFARRSFPPCF